MDLVKTHHLYMNTEDGSCIHDAMRHVVNVCRHINILHPSAYYQIFIYLWFDNVPIKLNVTWQAHDWHGDKHLTHQGLLFLVEAFHFKTCLRVRIRCGAPGFVEHLSARVRGVGKPATAGREGDICHPMYTLLYVQSHRNVFCVKGGMKGGIIQRGDWTCI